MLNIYTAEGIKAWDNYSILNQNIDSIDLMERAAQAFCSEFKKDFPYSNQRVYVFCGPGNNGGDGYAIARILRNSFYEVSIVEFASFDHRTKDAETMRSRAKEKIDINFTLFSKLDKEILDVDIVIDAIFGSGLNREIQPDLIRAFEFINSLDSIKVAVDIPSGAFINKVSSSEAIYADICYTFQSYKYILLFPESQAVCKLTKCINIGLSSDFKYPKELLGQIIEITDVQAAFPKREKFAHKYTFGHALFLGGSTDKMGAALLACRACMQTGVGLLTAHIPNTGNTVFNLSLPEAMLLDETKNVLSTVHKVDKVSALAGGPGMGTEEQSQKALLSYIKTYNVPCVLDADALNIIAKVGLEHLPKNAILTPHPGEFKRLFGETVDSIQRHRLQITKSKEHEVFILLKGAHSCLTTPRGDSYFLTIGNVGMATAGSGDVLTGIILSLIAQGIAPKQAAISGMYLHALAGDLAKKKLGTYAVTASSIIENIAQGILKIQRT